MKLKYSLRISLLGTSTLLASQVHAQTASFTVNSASAQGDQGNSLNSTQTGSFTESFIAQSLSWSGTVSSSPNFFFFEEDVHASIQGPNNMGYTGPIAGQQGIFLGATPFSGWSSGFTPASVNGDWSFEAYTPNTQPDATNWTLQSTEFSFNQSLFPSSSSISIGSEISAGLTEGQIQWYSINHFGGSINFSTSGSTIFELDGAIQVDDTLIALFDSTGMLVASNDNASATDFTSLLTFEQLNSGEYHLAVTGSTLGTRVGDNFISTSHDGVGTINLSVTVPSPSSALSIVIGALCTTRRRH